MKNKLKIELRVATTVSQYVGDESNGYTELECIVRIDDVEIKQYSNVWEFFTDVVNKGVNTPYYYTDRYGKDRDFHYNLGKSSFYPFNCSCGEPGCASIWNGVMSKHKKNTVIWKTKKDDGYHFMKSFYEFDKKQYIDEIVKAFITFKSISYVKVDHHGGPVTIEEYYKNYFNYEEVDEYMSSLITKEHFNV